MATEDEMLSEARRTHNRGVLKAALAKAVLLHLRHRLVDCDTGDGEDQCG